MSESSRTPSLNALRAFVAAGKRLNLRAAAADLHVTPSALSHQIRALEEQLGVKLFERSRRGLSLTAAGKALHPRIASAFADIHDALREIRPRKASGAITVSMLSTFAMRWFIPRLHRFQRLHPEIEVRISTGIELVDFEREDVDCAIRSGQGRWPGVQALRLLDEQFTPVCSPSLPSKDKPLAQPADLARHTLLNSRLRPNDWHDWLTAAGLPELKPAHTLEFETRNFAIAAAIRGLGVAIIDPLLVEEELKDGRLLQPFAQTLPTRSAYYLVWSSARRESPELRAFRAWLTGEAAR